MYSFFRADNNFVFLSKARISYKNDFYSKFNPFDATYRNCNVRVVAFNFIKMKKKSYFCVRSLVIELEFGII